MPLMHALRMRVYLTVISVGLGALEQDELSTYLNKFTNVWVAYALLLIAYVQVLSVSVCVSLSISRSLSLSVRGC
jgi:hypothetical protein